MERREFVTMMAGAMAAGRLGGSTARRTRLAEPIQASTLGPEVFARRRERLRAELTNRDLSIFVSEPGTNFEYLVGYSPGRSERLILLMVPAVGEPVIVCPSFEGGRIRRNSTITELRGWDEHDDPWDLVKPAAQTMRPKRGGGKVAIEGSTRYQMVLRMQRALTGWQLRDGTETIDRLRLIKSPEELGLIQRAIGITEASIAATFGQLAAGMTERDVSRILSREMQTRGGSGGGLVQFGPSSALPHGGPGGTPLAKETVVLIDGGCDVEGYTSDITRTIWFGDAPSDEFKRVFNTVHDAQTAAMELAKPFTVECQQLDRAARAHITSAGLGEFFTHRLGHGMGMDGHEHPYLVEGNDTRLEAGMVFTIEPGIYQLGKWGVRIEDDCVMTNSGLEVMSQRPPKL